MANEVLKRDDDRVTVIGGVTDDANQFITQARMDPATGRLKVSATISGSLISSHIQTDIFTSTNNQTIFNSTQTVISTLYFSVNGLIQTPTADYTTTTGSATLLVGIPAGQSVIWQYIF